MKTSFGGNEAVSDRTMPSRREAVIAAGALMTGLGTSAGSAAPASAAPADLASVAAGGGDATAFHAAVTARLATERTALVRTTNRWRDLAPRQAERAVADADAALAGMLLLPGTGGKPGFVGNPIDWARNPTGSAEYIASLNRMGHWQTMLRAWLLTGDARYPRKVVAELDSWIATCVRPPLVKENYTTIEPWRALEVGIRMGGSWPFMLRALAGTEWMPADRLARLAVTLHQHGEVLSTITPQLWPTAAHNHFLFEMTGLLSLATLLPELKGAAGWRDQAWHELERCAVAQITPDGGQIEGCPHYHNIAVSLFCESLRIGQVARLNAPPILRERVGAAMTYTLHSCRPTGDNVPWGDSDTTHSATTALIAGADALDEWTQLTVLAGIVGQDSLRQASLRDYTELARPDAVLARVADMRPAAGPLVYQDRQLDQATARTGWTARASSVFFGCHSPVVHGHSHQDPASFDFCAEGRPIIVDPGRYTYAEGLERRAFKSATRHNTVTINDREPFAYVSIFEFGPSQEGRIVRRFDLPGLTAFEALNRNFAPAVHRRLLLLSAAGELTLVDRIEGLGAADRVQLWFHFDSTSVTWDGRAASARTADAGAVNVSLATGTGLSGRVLPGYVSDAIDVRRPSQRLRLEDSGQAATRLFVTQITTAGMPAMAGTREAVEADGRIRFLAAGRPLLWVPERSLADT